jgi:phosphoglycolate phosphatase
MIPKPRLVIFDWDNTLIDSWPTINQAINVTLRAMGQPEWSLDETRSRVALSLRDSFPARFGDRWPEARQIFYDAFAAIHLEWLTPLPWAADLLDGLAAMGVPMAVVSNKNGRFLREEAQRLGWTERFHRLVGAQDAARDKPAVEPILLALEGTDLAPGPEIWMVGDAPIDMECAHKAGLTPLLLRDEPPGPEFTGREPLRHLAAGPDLLAWLRTLG